MFHMKMYDDLGLLDFLYLLQTLQQIFIFFYLDSIKNIAILICHSFNILFKKK